eukprot:m.193724 g.193724  ORF g.193724 m.193724 type:complete len:92 (-) comp15187_c0_seq17:1246-1521(-)
MICLLAVSIMPSVLVAILTSGLAWHASADRAEPVATPHRRLEGCATDDDCSLLGKCGVDKVCVCDSGWGGADCGELQLEPVKFGTGYNLTG